MRALRLDYRDRGLTVADHPEPAGPGPGQARIRLVEGGVCGTDRELAGFVFGRPPEGESALILGHEAVGLVDTVGSEVTHLRPGDLVVPLVRRNCGPQCAMCRRGRRDNCLTGEYTERGIMGLHGYLCEWAVDDAADLVPVPATMAEVAVLVEPASVIEKAWEMALRLHAGEPERVLVLGAGPIGILAAWCARHAGFEVHVVSREPEDSPRAKLLRTAGVTYSDTLEGGRADIILEACGSAEFAMAAMGTLRPLGVMVLLGARPAEVRLPSIEMIVGNHVLAGSVNASRAHLEAAITRLAAYDRRWLDPLLHRLSLAQAPETIFQPPAGAVKIVHRIYE